MSAEFSIVPPEPEVSALLRALVNEQRLAPELLEICRLIAAKHAANGEDSAALAFEFLDHLFTSGNTYLTSRGGLEREFRRFRTRQEDPAYYELWRIVSTAVNALVDAGEARKLDRRGDESANEKWTQLTAFPPELDAKPFDLVDFDARAARIPTFHPDRSRKTDPQRERKIISPDSACELVRLILQAAQGPIELGQVFEEARNHVFFFHPVQLRAEEEAGAGARLKVEPDARLGLEEEARVAAERIWTAAGDERRVLCGYYLPKLFSPGEVSARETGDPKRVSESKDRLDQLFQRELRVPRLAEESGEQYRLVCRLLAEMLLAKLTKKCSES